jgi:hypothetical protein
MGFLKKLTPSKKEMFSKAPEAKKDAEKQTAAAPSKAPSSAKMPVSDPDDEPTVFTVFMILYYGLFGITLAVYPSVWALDGPFPNPMAYWKTVTPDTQFAFHMIGVAFLVLVLGPFLDDIFGGAGVKFKAFTQQMLLINIFLFFIFLYYAYYAPLANAVGFMWKFQACFCGFIVGWNILEGTGATCKDIYALFTAGYFGFFAVGTMSIPSILFGPPSPVAYWQTWTELSLLTCRSFGAAMFCCFILGYVYYGGTGGYCKMCTLINLVFLGLFIHPAYFGGSAAVAGMWEIQMAMQIPIVVLGVFLELTGSTGPWTPSFSLSCGANASTFNFVNLLFQLPFAIAFFSVPDLMFGPANPMGMGIFTVDLDEPALWHGKAWAAVLFMVVIGPYLFGVPAIKTTKQMTVAYGLFCALFAYVVFVAEYEIFNTMVFYPLAGLNLVFFLAGLYLCLPAQAGEPML